MWANQQHTGAQPRQHRPPPTPRGGSPATNTAPAQHTTGPADAPPAHSPQPRPLQPERLIVRSRAVEEAWRRHPRKAPPSSPQSEGLHVPKHSPPNRPPQPCPTPTAFPDSTLKSRYYCLQNPRLVYRSRFRTEVLPSKDFGGTTSMPPAGYITVRHQTPTATFTYYIVWQDIISYLLNARTPQVIIPMLHLL